VEGKNPKNNKADSEIKAKDGWTIAVFSAPLAAQTHS
jgi:hypothetical protein